MIKYFYYQNVQYAIVKNQDLLKNKKQKEIVNSLGLRTLLSKVPQFQNYKY